MGKCAALGVPGPEQEREVKEAGLDYYTHNLDTSPQYHKKIISTRTYQDRLDTLKAVRDAGMNVCCGGIVGIGGGPQDPAGHLPTLPTPPRPPENGPLKHLGRVGRTPPGKSAAV